MTEMAKRIYDELVRRFEENSWDDVKITMKSTGEELTLIACSQGIMDITGVNDVEYVLVTGCKYPYMLGGDSLELVAGQLSRYDELISEMKDDEKKLYEFFKQHIENMDWETASQDVFGYYSDWHKDVFGFRPRGLTFGVKFGTEMAA